MSDTFPELGASNPTSVVVGVASGLILREKANRKSILFVNDSVNVIYISKRNPAVINTGIRLNPNGGAYWEPDTAFRIWRAQWYAIATGALSNLCITEDW